jgi:hypothetical protein
LVIHRLPVGRILRCRLNENAPFILKPLVVGANQLNQIIFYLIGDHFQDIGQVLALAFGALQSGIGVRFNALGVANACSLVQFGILVYPGFAIPFRLINSEFLTYSLNVRFLSLESGISGLPLPGNRNKERPHFLSS